MISRLITIFTTILIFILPITITPGNEYNTGKIGILLMGGAILLILMLANYKKLEIDKKDRILLIFAGLIFISTMCSEDIMTSIIGGKNRFEGMLTLYIYIIIYFCAKKFIKYKNKKNLLIILHILYILVSTLGVLQYFIKLPTNEFYPIFNRGVCGTFGNTNFMGNFISMGIPIFMITYILKGSKLSLITSILVFFCLIACHARSGWVAFFVFSIILMIYLMKYRNKKFFKRTIILIICFSAIFVLLYYTENSSVRTKFMALVRDIVIVQNEKTIETQVQIGSGRVQIWKITLELIQKYPLIGVGTDNMKNAIIQNLTQTTIDFVAYTGTIPDKAHNEYLQIAVTLGIPALILYLVFICKIVLPKVKDTFNKEHTFMINSVLVSYLVQAFFNISTIGVAPLFWFTLGIADNKFINEEQ